ncbi:hypothetical protein CFP56_016020 [Quercus suber]|uniref:Uncharacterized protein n=1 Tax=Quercus suber TaxID=58331 RepID=A0AAW0KNR4_QUESU
MDTQQGNLRKEDQQYRVWLKASLERSQQRPNIAPSTPDHRATTMPTTTGGPTANLAEPQNNPNTSTINATRHTPPNMETLNAYDHLKSHINEIAQATPTIPQEQTLTPTDAHASTPIIATITDALMPDPKTSSHFTTAIIDTKAKTPLIPTKEDKTQNGQNTIAPAITAQPLATWKRKNKAQRPKDSKDANKPQLGPKRKSSGISLDTSPNSSGLALLWKPESKVAIQGFSRWHIDAHITCIHTGIIWRLASFYGQPDTSKHEETWTLLESLGDYNEIVSQAESSGSHARPARQMERFKQVINYCGFHVLGFVGPPFTWSKSYRTEGRLHTDTDTD